MPSALRRFAPWLLAAAAHALFLLWYDGLSAPLSSAEVERFTAQLRSRGATQERVETVRAFLADDDGGDFAMANFIAFRDAPEPVGEMRAGESGREALGRYMAYMTPALLARASHPLLGGDAAANAVEVWGLPNAERWSLVGVVRYRSRRDLVEIASDPRFADAHLYKLAAMEKTIAVPISRYFLTGGPRVIVALVLIATASLAHAVRARRSAP
jgi:hypothetical protein